MRIGCNKWESKIRLLTLLFIATATVWGHAAAASFDCLKAKSEVEKAVCANKELSALDGNLAVAYRDLLVNDRDATTRREEQREWLQNLTANCQPQDKFDACLVDQYKKRMSLLKALKALQDPGKISDTIGSRYSLADISRKYDFVVHLLERCEPAKDEEEGSCEGPGIVTVFPKGDKTPLQVIPMDNVFVSFTKSGKPLANSASLYDYQGVINVGDFNFDGEEDFAIQNGNHGSYGGPSYDVYLKDQKRRTFVYNANLSELIDGSLGFFQVDEARKRLTTFAKSGCCYHETTAYAVKDNMPVPVTRVVDDARGDEGTESEERWERGKWKVVKTQTYRPDGYCEETLAAAADALGHGGSSASRTCKPLPNDKQVGVVALVYPSDGKDWNKDDRGLDVALAGLNGGSVLAKYSKKDEFKFGRVDLLNIDTARYRLAADVRAFGVRTSFFVVKNNLRWELLNLYHRKGDHLIPVLHQLTTYQRANGQETIRTLEMAKTESNGFADILVHEITRQIAIRGQENSISKQSQSVVNKDYLLHYNGNGYVLQPELISHP
ncbi:lysozyme inhibitor LprI family protein [Collimonas sp.]|uniref:lysozyme inhibitor LprI family protein n=1 Tax=Collimonas sp. TaxID=1963772 RepID=UPI002CECF9F2|nr:lysozyme inhibitor LprI family protein [Collimonas sp.]HWW04630.1 lysozyme inhibitor LprI family protein [Collimonas sp.]